MNFILQFNLSFKIKNLLFIFICTLKFATLNIMASTLEMHNPPPTKVIVLISGNGSNLQALIDASSTIMPYLKIIRVISNKKGVKGLERAQKANIPTTVHNLITGGYHKSRKMVEEDPKLEQSPEEKQGARERYDQDLAKLVLEDKPDLVVCAGWMHILAPAFLDRLSAENVPIINLHPALPGKFDGAGAIERAYNDFKNGKLEDDTTGIMIHYVISEVDRGDPIVVREIQCKSSETLEELQNRIHEQEHELIVEGTKMAIIKLWEARRKKSS